MADVTPYGAALSQSREYAVPQTTDWGAQMSSDIATWSADKKAAKEEQESRLTDYASRVLVPSSYQMYDGAYELNRNWATQLSDPEYIKQMTSTPEGVIKYEQALTGLQNSIAEHTDHYNTTYGTAQDDSSMATFSGSVQRLVGPSPYLDNRLEDTNGTDYYQGVLDDANNTAKYSAFNFNPETGLMTGLDGQTSLGMPLDLNLFKPNLSEIPPLGGGGWFQEVEGVVDVSYSNESAARASLTAHYNKAHLKSSVFAQGDAARIYSIEKGTAENDVPTDADQALAAENAYIDEAMKMWRNSSGRIDFLREEKEAALALQVDSTTDTDEPLPFTLQKSKEGINGSATYFVKASSGKRAFDLNITRPGKEGEPDKSTKTRIGAVHFDSTTGEVAGFELLTPLTGIGKKMTSFNEATDWDSETITPTDGDFETVLNAFNDTAQPKTQISGVEFLRRGKAGVIERNRVAESNRPSTPDWTESVNVEVLAEVGAVLQAMDAGQRNRFIAQIEKGVAAGKKLSVKDGKIYLD
mgnify:FL=1